MFFPVTFPLLLTHFSNISLIVLRDHVLLKCLCLMASDLCLLILSSVFFFCFLFFFFVNSCCLLLTEKKDFLCEYEAEVRQLPGDAEGSRAQRTPCSNHPWWSVLQKWRRLGRAANYKDMVRPKRQMGRKGRMEQKQKIQNIKVLPDHKNSVCGRCSKMHHLNPFVVVSLTFPFAVCTLFCLISLSPLSPLVLTQRKLASSQQPLQHATAAGISQDTVMLLLFTWWATEHTELS